MAIAEDVRDLVAPLLAAEGLELYDVEAESGTIRVFVDRVGGIDLDGVSLATHLVSDALDAQDPVPGADSYLLEVSSPGVERRLRTPAHFSCAIGRNVRVKTLPSASGERRAEGIIVAADPGSDGGLTLERVDDRGRPLEPRTIPYAEVSLARTVFVWGSATSTSAPKGARKKPLPDKPSLKKPVPTKKAVS